METCDHLTYKTSITDVDQWFVLRWEGWDGIEIWSGWQEKSWWNNKKQSQFEVG